MTSGSGPENSNTLKTDLVMAFASPILRFQVPGAAKLNAVLIEECLAIRESSPGLNRSNRSGWHSDTDLLKRKEPGLYELTQHINDAFKAATKAISPGFDETKYRLVGEGWININPKDGYNVPHDHSGFLWSGCYYVTVPERKPEHSRHAGSIQFLSPVTLPREYRMLDALCYRDRITIRPNPGDMLLFPSYLSHWVFPNEADEERITIAFNGTYTPA